jgi:hypothetical protein
MDELFEALTLIQTGKMEGFPIVIMGAEFWRPMLDFFCERLVAAGTISKTDADLVYVTDSVDEAVAYIRAHRWGGNGNDLPDE